MTGFVNLRGAILFVAFYFIIAIIVMLMLAFRHAHAGAFRGLTADMINVALSSAHINTSPGSQMKLLDRRTGQWHDFVLRRFSVRAGGQRAVIEIDADEVN